MFKKYTINIQLIVIVTTMIDDKTVNDLLITALKLKLLSDIEPNLNENQRKRVTELQEFIDKLHVFLNAYSKVDDFLKFGPNQLPETIQGALHAIKQFFVNELNASQQKNLTEKVHPFALILELYQTEKNFINDVNKIDIRRLIQLAKRYLPKFFKQNPLFEDFLSSALNYKSALPLAINDFIEGKLEEVIAKISSQLNSEDYLENVAKMSLISSNFKLLNQFLSQLSEKVSKSKHGGDIAFIGTLAAELIKPVQRAPRIILFLLDLHKRAIPEIVDNLQSMVENYKEKVAQVNLLVDMTDKHPCAASSVNRLQQLRQAHLEMRHYYLAVLNRKIQKIRDDLQSIHDHSQLPHYQKEGIQELIEKLRNVQVKYNSLKISDPLPTLSNEIARCINEVKKTHPAFKLNGNLVSLPKRAAQFDKQIDKEQKKLRIIENQVTLDIVLQMQLNMLNGIILKLQQAQQRINQKAEQSNKPNRVIQEKQQGLNNLIQSFNNMRASIEQRPQICYSESNDLSRKIKATLDSQKKQTPLLTAGLFSKTSRLLKSIEKESARHDRDYINPSIANPKRAFYLKEQVQNLRNTILNESDSHQFKS